jgi:hypothetical protein
MPGLCTENKSTMKSAKIENPEEPPQIESTEKPAEETLKVPSVETPVDEPLKTGSGRATEQPFEFEEELPEAEEELPEVGKELPTVEGDLLKVEEELPKVEVEPPKVEDEEETSEPDLPDESFYINVSEATGKRVSSNLGMLWATHGWVRTSVMMNRSNETKGLTTLSAFRCWHSILSGFILSMNMGSSGGTTSFAHGGCCNSASVCDTDGTSSISIRRYSSSASSLGHSSTS